MVVKILFPSGYRYQSPHVKALSTGYKDYFLKPFPLGTRIISSSPFHLGIRIISSYKSIGDGNLEFEKNYGQTQKIYPWSKCLHHFWSFSCADEFYTSSYKASTLPGMEIISRCKCTQGSHVVVKQYYVI